MIASFESIFAWRECCIVHTLGTPEARSVRMRRIGVPAPWWRMLSFRWSGLRSAKSWRYDNCDKPEGNGNYFGTYSCIHTRSFVRLFCVFCPRKSSYCTTHPPARLPRAKNSNRTPGLPRSQVAGAEKLEIELQQGVARSSSGSRRGDGDRYRPEGRQQEGDLREDRLRKGSLERGGTMDI